MFYAIVASSDDALRQFWMVHRQQAEGIIQYPLETSINLEAVWKPTLMTVAYTGQKPSVEAVLVYLNGCIEADAKLFGLPYGWRLPQTSPFQSTPVAS